MPEDNYFFTQKEWAVLSGTWTQGILRTRQMLYQLSYQCSSAGRCTSFCVGDYKHSALCSTHFFIPLLWSRVDFFFVCTATLNPVPCVYIYTYSQHVSNTQLTSTTNRYAYIYYMNTHQIVCKNLALSVYSQACIGHHNVWLHLDEVKS